MPGRGDRGRRRAVATDEIDQFFLALAEARSRIDRGLPGFGEPPEDLVAPRGVALAKRLRQRAEEHLAERVVIVVGGPVQEPEGRFVPERQRIDRGAHLLELRARQLALGRMGRHDADRAAAPERDANARARHRDRGAGLRQVIETTPERRVENDLENGSFGAQNCFLYQEVANQPAAASTGLRLPRYITVAGMGVGYRCRRCAWIALLRSQRLCRSEIVTGRGRTRWTGSGRSTDSWPGSSGVRFASPASRFAIARRPRMPCRTR